MNSQRPTLQVTIGSKRGVDPEVAHKMHIEAALRRMSLGELLNLLWQEHEDGDSRNGTSAASAPQLAMAR